MTRKLSLVRAFFAATALSLAPTAQSLIVVDESSGPGSQFADIQDAIAIAVDGDVVLVRSGTYEGFSIEDKAVTVTSDSGAKVRIRGSVRVTNLDASRAVTLNGLLINPRFQGRHSLAGRRSLRIERCAGPVFVQRCRVWFVEHFGPDQVTVLGTLEGTLAVGHGVSIRESDDVVLVDTLVGLGEAGFDTNAGAITIFDSTVSIYGGATVGMHAKETAFSFGTKGQDALVIRNGSTVHAYGSAFTGGRGAPAPQLFPVCPDGGDGGVGVEISGSPPSRIYSRDTRITGGQGGKGSTCGTGVDGKKGKALLLANGTIRYLGGDARAMIGLSPIRENDPVRLTIRAEPFDFVWLQFGSSQTSTFFDPLGTLVVGGPGPSVFIGQLGAAGTLELAPPLQELGVGITFLTLYLQLVTYSPTDGVIYGTPRSWLLMNA